MSINKKLDIVVVDDEVSARDGLVQMLKHLGYSENVEVCSNGIEAIKYLTVSHTDLVFLDIQMPLVDGFDVLRSIPPDKIPYVVFVTAFDDFAVEAFKFHALDYVLKPFSDNRLKEILTRVHKLVHEKEQLKNIEELLKKVKPDTESRLLDVESKKKLVFKEDGVVRFLNTAEIDWIEAFDYYVKLHAKQRTYLVRTSIKKILTTLDLKVFLRIHRSSVINVKNIESIDTKSGEWIVQLKTGKQLKVGRVYKGELMKYINK